MARLRTTKALAKRIELEYFKRPHPFRRWKRFVAIVLPTVSAVWLIIMALQGDERIYTSEMVSVSHSMFAKDCAQCHQGEQSEIHEDWKFWRDVSDSACLSCHDGLLHHTNQLFTPRCSVCHEEHRGEAMLARVGDQHCTRCHAELKTQAGTFQIVAEDGRRISKFESAHPEFSISLRGRQGTERVRLDKTTDVIDTTQIKLNHQVHLKPGLFGPERQPVQMKCSDCHQLDVQGAYMREVNYEKHCMTCHLLEYDSRFQTAERDKQALLKAYEQLEGAKYIADHPEQFPVVPHEKSELIRSFLQDRYSEYVLQHPEQISRQEETIIRRLPRRTRYRQLPVSTREWVDNQVLNAETFLYRKACKECHTFEVREGELPVIVEPNIPTRWFQQSVFDHKAHRALQCVGCHQNASESRATSDVLLPGIASCRTCHNETVGAPSQCSACHFYHDKSKMRDLNGRFSIQDLAPR
jgi:hypothetical protein